MSISKPAVLWTLFLIVAFFITPPDLITQITTAAMMAIIYGLLTLVISRFKLLEDTPKHTKTVVAFLFSVGLTLLVLHVL